MGESIRKLGKVAKKVMYTSEMGKKLHERIVRYNGVMVCPEISTTRVSNVLVTLYSMSVPFLS